MLEPSRDDRVSRDRPARFSGPGDEERSRAVSDDKTKILYIAGFGRSGSTLLGNILGEIEGFFHGGELNFVWDQHDSPGNRLCGCGAPFHECEEWGLIMGKALRGMDNTQTARLQKPGPRTRHMPLMLFERGKSVLASHFRNYITLQERLYRAVTEVTGSRVVVDSSKSPAYGYVLGTMPGIELYVVHLIRDPRAAAYSWLRKKPQPGADRLVYMDRVGPVKSSLLWDSWNVSSDVLWMGSPGRYMRLRYEDFVENPRRIVRDILGMLREDAAELPFTNHGDVELGVNHTVSGNPDRFRTGTVRLRPDAEWARRMRPRDRALVTLLTLPLLPRYGYPLVADDTQAG